MVVTVILLLIKKDSISILSILTIKQLYSIPVVTKLSNIKFDPVCALWEVDLQHGLVSGQPAEGGLTGGVCHPGYWHIPSDIIIYTII